MGVPGLWKVVEPASQLRSLTQISVTEGYIKNRHGFRSLVVGIDASIWLNECQFVHTNKHNRWQRGMNPELRTLFYKLARLLPHCIIPVFVFDGPQRPHLKRGTKVHAKDHWATQSFKDLIAGFGFHSHMAPGEAEAELAYLNNIGILDAVMTEDVDALIFGANVTIRSPFPRCEKIKWDGDTVRVYTAAAVMENIAISRGGMILYALLCGGDYDKAGLRGCGDCVAQGLARSPLASALYTAAKLSSADLQQFLPSWRQELILELTTNKSGFINQRQPALAQSIGASFPNPSIILQYVNPITSGAINAAVDSRTWVPHQVDLKQLAIVSKRLFNWTTLETLPKKFQNSVWAGACIRRLTEPFNLLDALDEHVNGGQIDDGNPPLSSFLRITRVAAGRQLLSSLAIYTLRVEVHCLLSTTLSGLTNNPITRVAKTMSVQIPAPIIDCRLPGLHHKSCKMPVLSCSPKSILSASVSRPQVLPRQVIDLTDDAECSNRTNNFIDLTI